MTDLAREGENLLMCYNVPIIFVPGVMGSRLKLKGGVKWDPGASIHMLWHWVLSRANTRQNQLDYTDAATVIDDDPLWDDVTEEEKGRGWEGVAEKFYVPFLRALEKKSNESQRCPVYAIGYDWRQSNYDSGLYIAGKIRDILEKEESDIFVLVSHSMGGLATRGMLHNAANSDVANKMLAVVHVAQPATGAPVFYRRYITGGLAPEDGDPSSGSIMDRIGALSLLTIMGRSPEDFAKVLSKTMGPQELMPNNFCRDTNGTSSWLREIRNGIMHDHLGDIFQKYLEARLPPGVFADHNPDDENYQETIERVLGLEAPESFGLPVARRYHDRVKDYKHPKTYAVFATDVITEVGVLIDRDKRYPSATHKPDEESLTEKVIETGLSSGMSIGAAAISGDGQKIGESITKELIKGGEKFGAPKEVTSTAKTLLKGVVSGLAVSKMLPDGLKFAVVPTAIVVGAVAAWRENERKKEEKIRRGIVFQRRREGDGTVPFQSGSALFEDNETTTMPNSEEAIKELVNAGTHRQFKLTKNGRDDKKLAHDAIMKHKDAIHLIWYLSQKVIREELQGNRS